MADLAITISNRIDCFGPAPSTKWGVGANYTMTWGVSQWGEGTEDLAATVHKALSESVGLSDALTLTADFHVTLSNSLASTQEMSSEQLLDPAGWYYVFASNTSQAEDRDIPNYSSGSVASVSYTSAAATSTSWS